MYKALLVENPSQPTEDTGMQFVSRILWKKWKKNYTRALKGNVSKNTHLTLILTKLNSILKIEQENLPNIGHIVFQYLHKCKRETHTWKN